MDVNKRLLAPWIDRSLVFIVMQLEFESLAADAQPARPTSALSKGRSHGRFGCWWISRPLLCHCCEN